MASIGDINGDGFDDVAVATQGRWSWEIGLSTPSATAYILYGGEAGVGDIDLDQLKPSQGFKIDISGLAHDEWGWYYDTLRSIRSIGDLNHDGIDDFIIESTYTPPFIQTCDIGVHTHYEQNDCYVIYGKKDGFSDLTLSDIKGVVGKHYDYASRVTIDDRALYENYQTFIISTDSDDPSNVIVIPEPVGPYRTVETIDAPAFLEASSASSASFDVNGDGVADSILREPSGGSGAGEVLVLYGGSGAVDSQDIQPGQGFKLSGTRPGEQFGFSVDGAGDLNGDGYDDLIIGAAGAGQSFWQIYDFMNGGLVGDPIASDEPVFSVIPEYASFGWQTGEVYIFYGGNFSGAVTLEGTSGDDDLLGKEVADRIVAGRGNDHISGKGGEDVVRAGAGDDEISLDDFLFHFVDGGSGTDSLNFNFGGAIDFDPARIEQIEILDLTNGFTNELTLSAADVLAMDVRVRDLGGKAKLDNILTVEGEASDTLQLLAVGGWAVWSGTGGLAGYTLYASGFARLAVDTDIAVTIA